MSANGHAPRLCDPTAAADALRLIVGDGAVTELRALDATTRGDRWPHTESGYFNDPEKLGTALDQLASAKGVYITLNPVHPALLARAANRIRKAPKGETTSDTNIDNRRWLLIDLDAVRPSGISSTDAEHEAALAKAQAVELFLHDAGWPDPIFADSGNGAHLLYRIDLPADDGGLVKNVLAALAAKFDDAAVTIDPTVFNPARISKLYGTLACKGDDTPDRPHRMARIIDAPDVPQIVPVELLQELAALAPAAEQPRKPDRNGHASAPGGAFDVQAFIDRHGFDVSAPMPWHGQQGSGTRWECSTSPMCDHHGDGPYIVQHASGAVTAGCHHASCGWTWADLRNRFEPREQPRQRDRVYDGGDRYYDADSPQGRTAAEQQSAAAPKVEYRIITSAELASGDYAIDFAIEETLVVGAPLIVAGPQKVLKTSLLIDAAISLAVGGYFLGKLHANRARRVAVMTGESGLQVIQETANRICAAAGVVLAFLDNLIWSTDLPKFGNALHLAALERFLLDNGIEVLIIDPAYMTMPGADAGNLMMQGELLRGVNDVCQRCGVTLVLAHHTVKGAGRDSLEPLQLHDLAWAGFSEFAGQWWLVNRRERYEPGTGEHKLWLTVGGRAGHSALWALNVNEGLRTDIGGRRWEVDLQTPTDARDDVEQRRTDLKAQRQAEQLQGDCKAIVEALARESDCTATKSVVKASVGVSTARLDAALASLVRARDVCLVTITKGNNRSYEAFKLGVNDGQ